MLSFASANSPFLRVVQSTEQGLVVSMSLIPTFLDGGMTCNFMSFSTVFQSFQDDGRVIMKGCAQ